MGQVGLNSKLNYLDVTWIFIHHMFIRIWCYYKWETLGYGESTESTLVWNQLSTSSCFEACGVLRFHSQEICTWDQFFPANNEEIYGTVSDQNFSISFALLLKRKTSACGSYSDCSVGQQVNRCDPLSAVVSTEHLQ